MIQLAAAGNEANPMTPMTEGLGAAFYGGRGLPELASLLLAF
jgi:hypothetical protein